MAVKHSPQKLVQPEQKTQQITAPVFLDKSSLAIPTLAQLQANGELTPGAAVAPMSAKLAEKIYTDMVYTRLLDERMVGAQRQGRLSFYLTCAGEEASVAGTIAAFNPDDMVMAQYREQLALRYCLAMLKTSVKAARCRFTTAVASSTL
jgi:2-oxoisovalerate dehydrogenase E1 component alpha subunit